MVNDSTWMYIITVLSNTVHFHVVTVYVHHTMYVVFTHIHTWMYIFHYDAFVIMSLNLSVLNDLLLVTLIIIVTWLSGSEWSTTCSSCIIALLPGSADQWLWSTTCNSIITQLSSSVSSWSTVYSWFTFLLRSLHLCHYKALVVINSTLIYRIYA